VKGGSTVLRYDKFTHLRLESGDLSYLKFFTENGAVIGFMQILKSEELGGKPDQGIGSEYSEFDRLEKIINHWKKESGSSKIKIKVLDDVHEISEVNHIKGMCKADFSFSKKKEESIWVSHKKGTADRHFVSYVNFGKSSMPLSGFNEIQEFVSSIKNDDFVSGDTFKKEITTQTIKDISVYGKDFGSSFGKDNVQLILQGRTNIVPANSTVLELKGQNTFSNGQELEGRYRPIFEAHYDSRFNCFDRKNCRTWIRPARSYNASCLDVKV
jgi:hypothetical protein